MSWLPALLPQLVIPDRSLDFLPPGTYCHCSQFCFTRLHSSRDGTMSDPFLNLQHPDGACTRDLQQVFCPFLKWRSSTINFLHAIALIHITSPSSHGTQWLQFAISHFCNVAFEAYPFSLSIFFTLKAYSSEEIHWVLNSLDLPFSQRRKKRKKPLLIAFYSVINLLFKRHLVKLKIISLNHVFTPTTYKTLDYRSS